MRKTLAAVLTAGFLTAACSPVQHPESVAPVATNMVSIVDNAYNPPHIVVNRGQTVTWTNNGNLPHTVTSYDRLFGSGNIAPGQTYNYRFLRRGSYRYYCDYHSNMQGIVDVR